MSHPACDVRAHEHLLVRVICPPSATRVNSAGTAFAQRRTGFTAGSSITPQLAGTFRRRMRCNAATGLSSAAGGLFQQAAAHPLRHGGGPVGDAELLVEPLGVGLHRARPDEQLAGDLRDAQPAGERLQHLVLPLAEHRAGGLGAQPDLPGERTPASSAGTTVFPAATESTASTICERRASLPR